MQRTVLTWLFLAPTLIGLGLFTFLPILASIALAFFRWDIITDPQFVGLDNFAQIAADPTIRVSFLNTIVFVIIAVTLQLALALGLAVLAAAGAHDARRGAALAQASTARCCQLFVVDDLGRLARSGRIDSTTARLDGVLGIRPVLALTRDGIRTLETVRGAARARRHLIAQAVRIAGGTALSGPRHPADPVRLVIQGDDADKLALLETDLRQAMEEAGAKVSEVLTLPVDEATSTHVGPGALGIAVAPDLKTH